MQRRSPAYRGLAAGLLACEARGWVWGEERRVEMKRWAVLFVSILAAACANIPSTPPPVALLNDQLFSAPSVSVSAAEIFALSDDMRQYLATEIAERVRARGGGREGLFDALYSTRQLSLEYDSVTTRNAAQAFAARSGNCLSLVIMTAAFAKEMGLAVQYQQVFVEDTVSRSDDMYFFIGHVNLSLGPRSAVDLSLGPGASNLMTIDFIPPEERKKLRSRPISEQTIVAMYMNNRAAESLARGEVNDAYWWARSAIRHDAGFMSSYNTLGIIYRRHGNLKEAESVLSYALDREPLNAHVMSNLAGVLQGLGRGAESAALARKLEQMDPNPAFRSFNLGVKAMQQGNYASARDLFAKEVDRAPYYHEFHFWLALAYVGLGETENARSELKLALEYSTTRKEHELYAAKLDRIRSSHLQ